MRVRPTQRVLRCRARGSPPRGRRRRCRRARCRRRVTRRESERMLALERRGAVEQRSRSAALVTPAKSKSVSPIARRVDPHSCRGVARGRGSARRGRRHSHGRVHDRLAELARHRGRDPASRSASVASTKRLVAHALSAVSSIASLRGVRVNVGASKSIAERAVRSRPRIVADDGHPSLDRPEAVRAAALEDRTVRWFA